LRDRLNCHSRQLSDSRFTAGVKLEAPNSA
jgi:hypothetical protein